jgi:DNA polymerase (family 10)
LREYTFVSTNIPRVAKNQRHPNRPVIGLPPVSPTAGTHNEDVAATFDEMAELLTISGENPFRVRAYQRAAQVVRASPRALAEVQRTNALDELPGIGADLAGKIDELLRTGKLGVLETLRLRVPAGLRELLRLPGLGPVRVRALNGKLGICSAEDLRLALATGKLAKRRGFGPALRVKLQEALETRQPAQKRWGWTVAAQYAEPLRDYLKSISGVAQVEIAGSYRRGRETVGDLDLVVCGARGLDLAAALRGYGDLRQLLAAGPTRCTVVLRNGLQVDLRLVRAESFGSALNYFTGSRDHNVHLRRRAQERGLKLNEYGLFRDGKRIAGATEKDVFAALGLPWIAPELREDRGELEAAERGELPKLIELADLQGDLHAHTDASDGRESLSRMVSAASALGLKFMAITDHSRHLGVVHGLDAGQLARQIDMIDALNEKLHDFVVLKGAEVDILEDGRLALPDSILGRLDVVVVAIHSHFDLAEAEQTSRVLRALERPYVSILAHPTGRLIGERAPYAIDRAKVLAAARARPCYLELNAQPSRLDIDDVTCKAAREQGVLVSIASDAHAGSELADLQNGVRQARRGWLTRADVLNARPLAQVRELLARTRL